MSLFNNYESAGSGISKYAPKKTGLALYFDLFFRKAWSLTGLTMLLFIFILPAYIAFFSLYYIKNFNIAMIVSVTMFLTFAITIGPGIAGMTKVIRLYLIEKHSFMIRDFFKGFKENFFRAAVMGILDIVAVMSAFSSYKLYPMWAVKYDNVLFYVPMVISLAVALVMLMMNYYIFPMMVATDLSMKNLFKNSFALAFVSIKQNLINTLMLLFFMVIMSIFLLYTTPMFFIIVPFFPAGIAWFTVCFNSYPIIQKYVINPYYDSIGETNPELDNDDEENSEEVIFEDMGGKEKPIEKRKKGKGKRIS